MKKFFVAAATAFILLSANIVNANTISEDVANTNTVIFSTVPTCLSSKYKTDFPENKDYVINENDETYEVLAIRQRETPKVPNDGTIYELYDYLPSAPGKRVDYFRFVGEVSTFNQTPHTSMLSYTQIESTTVEWDVTDNLNSTHEGDLFIRKLKDELGFSVSKTSTIAKSSWVTQQVEVPPNSSRRIEKYIGGVTSSGLLCYKRYAFTGHYIGLYYEKAGGTALIPSSNGYKVLPY